MRSITSAPLRWLLGIVVHASLSFAFWVRGVWVSQIYPSKLYDWIFFSIHGFRMQLFFLLAGYFSRLVYAKLGAAQFAAQRFQRVGLPFVFGLITLGPIIHSFIVYQATNSPQAALAFLFSGQFFLAFRDGVFFTVHLWFLYFLLIFYTLQLVILKLANGHDTFLQSGRNLFLAIARSPWKPVLLSTPLVAILSFEMAWDDFDRGFGIMPSWISLLYYGVFFSYGWLLNFYRNDLSDLGLPVSFPAGLLALAIGTNLLTTTLREFAGELSHPLFGLLKFACVLSFSVYGWSMIFLLMQLFLRYFSKPSPVLKYLADASYWIYLIHLPAVLLLQALLANVALISFLKFALTNLGALVASLISYRVFVQPYLARSRSKRSKSPDIRTPAKSRLALAILIENPPIHLTRPSNPTFATGPGFQKFPPGNFEKR